MNFKKFEHFEINDIWCMLVLLNVVLVRCIGKSFAWIGFGIAIMGILKDIFVDGLVMHGANMLMYIVLLFRVV